MRFPGLGRGLGPVVLRPRLRVSAWTMAGRGRVVPELDRLHAREHRELIVAPYRLVYRATPREIVVLAALDGRRNLEDVLLDCLIRLSDGEG